MPSEEIIRKLMDDIDYLREGLLYCLGGMQAIDQSLVQMQEELNGSQTHSSSEINLRKYKY